MQSPASLARDRAEGRTDRAREAAHVQAGRSRVARAVERLLVTTLDHEAGLPEDRRVPDAVYLRLEEIHAEVSHAIREGHEVSQQYRDDVIAYVSEHVRDRDGLVARMAEAVGE